MEKPDFDIRPALVTAAGGLLVILTALARGGLTQFSTWLLVLGGALALAGAWCYRRHSHLPDRALEIEKGQVCRDRDQMVRERKALDLYKSDVEEEALVLEKRRHKLSLQLAQTVGWWDLGTPEDEPPELPVSEEKERQVLAFCREESERLFNKVIENGYLKDGVLAPEEIYKDVTRLFEGVAHIYQPDSDHPLLETSMEQVLRFLHNVSLQLLVQLEQLPVDVKGFNLRETYRFVKRAMDYYGMYKKVNPYWNYAKPAIFLGRFALGANPIALGLSWTITELASIGGKKISTRYTRKYGLRLFHEAIRIVGSETAAVYGAKFRERDPDWVYATELIELVHHFPPSRESLESGLKEIGRLPLHSEYDRVYLYRCLANRFSAKPQTLRTRDVIGMTDGIHVAKRLERQFEQFYVHEEADRVEKWSRGVESRLGVKLQLTGRLNNGDLPEELLSAFYSLASYLLGHKMLELKTAEEHLSASRVAAAMEGEALSRALLRVRQAPPMVFDYPDLVLTNKVASWFLDDLITLQLEIFPREPDLSLLEEAAVYFREKPSHWKERTEERCREILLAQLSAEAPRPHIDCSMAQALLSALGPDERLQLLYLVSGVEGDITFRHAFKSLALIGTNRRPFALIGFKEAETRPGRLEALSLWIPDGDSLQLDHSKTFLTQAYRLRGGIWDPEHAKIEARGDAPTIRMRNRRGSSHEGYFQAFLDRFGLLGGRTNFGRAAMDGLGDTEPLS